MKKSIIIGVIVVLSILTAFLAMNKKEEVVNNKKPTVKIGISLPLTGNISELGIASKTAIELAYSKWLKKDTKYDYKLIIEDNQFNNKITASIANKLVNMDKVKTYFSLFSQGQLIGKTYTEKNKVINMGSSWGSEAQEGFYNINNIQSVNTLSDTLIKGLNKFNIKKVAIVELATAGQKELVSVLKNKMVKEDIDVIFEETVPIGMKDYLMMLSKVKDKNPDIIIALLFENDLRNLLIQMRNQGLDIPITTIEIFSFFEDKSILNDLWFVKYIIPNTNFSDKINKDVFTKLSATNSYDNLDMLIYAFENVNSKNGVLPTNKEVVDYILSMKKWEGVSQDLIIYEDGTIDSKAYLAVIKNGKIEIIEE